MAYYSNHNLAYDFALFEQEPVPAARSAKPKEEKPVAPDRKKKVNTARPASRERRGADARAGRKSKIQRLKRRKSGFARIALGAVFGLAAVFIIVSIIHGQVQLTEINQEIIDARAELAEKQSIYTQLEMKVDSSISTSAVEQYAQENLHMNKASNSQKEFISLSEGDKAEVILSESKNIFQLIGEAIASLWS